MKSGYKTVGIQMARDWDQSKAWHPHEADQKDYDPGSQWSQAYELGGGSNVLSRPPQALPIDFGKLGMSQHEGVFAVW